MCKKSIFLNNNLEKSIYFSTLKETILLLIWWVRLIIQLGDILRKSESLFCKNTVGLWTWESFII